MKKLIMTLVAAVAVAMPVMAAKEKVGDYTWSYRLNGSEAEIYCDDSYDGCVAISPLPAAGSVIAIPGKLGGKTVTIIGDGAFVGCEGLKGVTIPATVKSIGFAAFSGCKTLESVAIPKSVTTIDDRAFYRCSKLKYVSIPDGVTSIGEWAFAYCTSLNTLSLPNSVKSVGVRAFSDSYIKSIAFGSGLKGLGGYAFYFCGCLDNIIFTGNAPTVDGDGLFSNDSGDSSVIYVMKSTSGWGSVPGTWFDRPIRYATATYSVAFSANGGTGGKTFSSAGMGRQLSYYMNQLTPKRDGYAFNGWWTAKTGGVPVNGTDFVTGNATYYAQWTVPTYSIAFNANGGTGGKTFSIPGGTKLTNYMKKLAPKRAGYTFNGWWTARTGGTWVSPSTAAAGNKTYYAQWCELEFKSSGDVPWKQQYDGVWKSGAIADSEESFLTAVTYHEAGSITFKWKVSSEEGFDSLGFSVDYGDEAIISGTADTGWQEVSMYTEDDAESHVLEWVYVKDSSGSSGSDCGWVKDLVWRDAGTPVTIAFNANGGTGGKSFSAGVGRTLGYYMKQLTPKRDGYVFDGWWTAKTGGEQVTAVDYVTTDITYYARWK